MQIKWVPVDQWGRAMVAKPKREWRLRVKQERMSVCGYVQASGPFVVEVYRLQPSGFLRMVYTNDKQYKTSGAAKRGAIAFWRRIVRRLNDTAKV